jgi:hypothetical protein
VYPKRAEKEKGESKLNKKLLALSLLTILAIALVPVFALPPAPDPPDPPQPEIAVQVDGSWLHTLPKPPFTLPDDFDTGANPWSTDWTYCWDIPESYMTPFDDADVFEPFHLYAPQTSNTFEVDIWVLNVTKLYAYEFTLVWNYGWLDLQSYTLVDIGEGMGEQHLVDIDPFTAGTQPGLVQVWTHLGEVDGFTGSAVVAELVFHIHQDPVWENGNRQAFYSAIYILDSEASGPTTNEIVLSPKHGIVKIEATKMKAYMTPEDYLIVWTQDKQIPFTIGVENVVKMKSFYIEFWWDTAPEGYVDTQLILDPQKHPIEITDFLPGPYSFYIVEYFFDVESSTWDLVYMELWRDCDKPPINGTGDLATITLTSVSPWGYKVCSIPELCYEKVRKVIPPYKYYDWSGQCTEDHWWLPDECHDEIIVEVGIDGIMCVQESSGHWDLEQDRDAPYMGFYVLDPVTPVIIGSTWSTVQYFHTFPDMTLTYDFRPIAGDFDMDGHVGLVDGLAMTEFYGAPASLIADLMAKGLSATDAATKAAAYWAACISDYDIVGDPQAPQSEGEIDIFDLVAVAKNFCRSVPFHWPHEVPYLDP